MSLKIDQFFNKQIRKAQLRNKNGAYLNADLILNDACYGNMAHFEKIVSYHFGLNNDSSQVWAKRTKLLCEMLLSYPSLDFDDGYETNYISYEAELLSKLREFGISPVSEYTAVNNIRFETRKTNTLDALACYDSEGKCGGILFDTSLFVLCENICKILLDNKIVDIEPKCEFRSNPFEFTYDWDNDLVIKEIASVCRSGSATRIPTNPNVADLVIKGEIMEGCRSFIIYHEASHILRNHYNPLHRKRYTGKDSNRRYADELFSFINSLDEEAFSNIKLSHISDQRYQFAVEMDADSSSLIFLYNNVVFKEQDPYFRLQRHKANTVGIILVIWITELIERYINSHCRGSDWYKNSIKHYKGKISEKEMQRILSDTSLQLDAEDVLNERSHPTPTNRALNLIETHDSLIEDCKFESIRELIEQWKTSDFEFRNNFTFIWGRLEIFFDQVWKSYAEKNENFDTDEISPLLRKKFKTHELDKEL